MRECAICGSETVYEGRDIKISYKNNKTTITQNAYYCKSCGEGFLTSKECKEVENQTIDFKRKIDGFLTPSEIKGIRLRCKINQKEASKLFGGGPNAFSRYEKGITTQSKSTDILFRLLDAKKIRIQDIRDLESKDK
jgi:HTH-type transcriptional regulator/antitoxin MqsA